MKKISIIIGFFFACIVVKAQFGQSSTFHINVNNPAYFNIDRKGIRDATVYLHLTRVFIYNGVPTYSLHRNCTGTLINRKISDNELGYYILTANHCVCDNSGVGPVDIAFNLDQDVIFNYQSPNALNEATYPSNRGTSGNYEQSTDILDIFKNRGYEYLHKTKLRLVDHSLWGDLALLEVLTPIPPHYNVTYAGWNPKSLLGSGLINSPMVVIQHPKNDIKKIAETNAILVLHNPISTGCYTITTFIDVLFGWIWGRNTLTSQICNFSDNPWLFIPIYSHGLTQEGSSGSGIFDSSNQLLGVFSGGGDGGADFFGELCANYSKSTIRNVLNPTYDMYTDFYGIGERKITVYDNLVLPGGDGTKPGYYFPANHYQSENKIVLQARNNIETTQPIIVFTGADYEFVAGNSIKLRPGFIVQAGANFSAKIQSPGTMSVKSVLPEQTLIDRLKDIKLPETPKHYDRYTYNVIKTPVKIYPNPAKDIVNIDWGVSKSNELKFVELYSITGEVLLKKEIAESFESLNLQGLNNGIYVLKINSIDKPSEYFKILINR